MTSIKKAVAIGHITNDISPEPHLGGGASYTAVTLARLGFRTTIITKCRINDPYVHQLRKMNVKTITLSSEVNTITTFDNQYNEEGKRTQFVRDKQTPITRKDLNSLPDSVQDALILVAPVIGEVDMDTYPYLAIKNRMLAVIPQGYFRSISETGKVEQTPWAGFEEYLSHAKVTIFSDEDITIDGDFDNNLLTQIKSLSDITIVTRGERGATIFYNKGEDRFEIKAYKLLAGEAKDFTGAGDVFAATFLAHYMSHKDIQTAGVFACLFAAIKIKAGNGIGLNSVPTYYQLRQENPSRVQQFADQNNIKPENIWI